MPWLTLPAASAAELGQSQGYRSRQGCSKQKEPISPAQVAETRSHSRQPEPQRLPFAQSATSSPQAHAARQRKGRKVVGQDKDMGIEAGEHG